MARFRRMRPTTVSAPLVSLASLAVLGAALALLVTLTILSDTGSAAVDAAFAVVAGQGPANSGLNFNGTDKGHLVITVPVGAQVTLTLTNKGDLPHSLQIIPFTKTLPATAAAKPAIAGAQTPNPQAGINKGQTAAARFTATKAGKYLLICGFPGHALLGMYGVFEVSPSASTKPSLVIKK